MSGGKGQNTNTRETTGVWKVNTKAKRNSQSTSMRISSPPTDDPGASGNPSWRLNHSSTKRTLLCHAGMAPCFTNNFATLEYPILAATSKGVWPACLERETKQVHQTHGRSGNQPQAQEANSTTTRRMKVASEGETGNKEHTSNLVGVRRIAGNARGCTTHTHTQALQ